MKKLIFILFISYVSFIAKAQITFYKNFDLNTYGTSPKSIGLTDGNFIFCYRAASITAPLNEGIKLIKLNFSGDTIWTRFYRCPTNNAINTYYSSLFETSDKNVLITGSAGNQTILMKIDTSGNLKWSKSYSIPNGMGIKNVCENISGKYFLTGDAHDSMDSSCFYVSKCDTAGTIIWSKLYRFAGFIHNSLKIFPDNNSGFVILGNIYSVNSNSTQVFILKINSSGIPLWNKIFNAGSSSLFARNFKILSNNNLAIIATSDNSQAINFVTDSLGNVLWNKSYFPFYANDLDLTFDGGFILTGAGFLVNYYCGVIKTNNSGDTLWTRLLLASYNWTGNGEGLTIKQLADSTFLISAGLSTIIKTDSLGKIGCDTNLYISVDTLLINSYSLPVQFSGFTPTVNFENTTSSAYNFAYASNCASASLGIDELHQNNKIEVSPNPSYGKFIISFGKTIGKGYLEILNILGEKVFAENVFNESKKEIKLKNISAGIYFVKVIDGEKYYCKKIFIEQN